MFTSLGGVAEMREDGITPKSEFFVALVGPVTSLLLGGFWIGLSELLSWWSAVPSLVYGVSFWLGTINIILGASSFFFVCFFFFFECACLKVEYVYLNVD